MVHFWTTQQLQQHLPYISIRTGRNPCYQALRKSGYAAIYERVGFPTRVRGLEAIPCEGPLGHFPPLVQTQISQWLQGICRLEQSLGDIQWPLNRESAASQLHAGLTQTARNWFAKSCEHSFDLLAVGQLEDHWFDYFSTWLNELDDWYADELLKRGQTELPDVIADFVDGEVEGIADEAFYKVTKGMPRCQMRDRIAFLTQCIARAETELATDVQHRPKCDKAAATRNKIRKK